MNHPGKILLLLLLLCVFPAGFAASSGQVAQLEGVRLRDAPDYTRVVFDLSRDVEYSLFTLSNPDRVVMDLQNSRWRHKKDALLQASGYLKGLRSARRSDNTLRLVLDLNQAVKPRSFLLKPNQGLGNRLVVDLYPVKNTKVVARQPVKSINASGQRYRDVVIAIDAGHGGEDPGALGRRYGTKEKHITLAVARKLASRINRQQGMKAVLIRDGDYYLKLRQRIRKAREHRADLFLSLHADAFHNPKVKGSSVYILSERGASSEAAKWLAKRENAADELMGGVTLDDKDDLLKSVLLDLSQTATIEASADLAQTTLKKLKGVGKVHRRHVERAGFAVLKSPDIPSVLVELAFISNPAEERKLKDDAHQDKMADAILEGVRLYLKKRPPDNTLFAARTRTHTIKRGDTLSALAKRYQTSSSHLRKVNGLTSDSLRIGQVIHIPAGS